MLPACAFAHRQVLTYPETGSCMSRYSEIRRLIALHSGLAAPCGRSLLRRAFRFAPPSDGLSRFRPCLRLILLLMFSSIDWIHV